MENIKKYGFVFLIAVFMLIFVVYYAVDAFLLQNSNKTNVTAKIKDNESVLYSINDKDYTASNFYQEALPLYGNLTTIIELQKLVVDSIKTTSQIEQVANNYAAQYRHSKSEEEILKELRRFGYDNIKDLKKMIVFQLKLNDLNVNYLKEHLEDLVKPFVEANKSSYVSHILIKVSSVETTQDGSVKLNPSEEEKAKLAKVLEEIKTKDFSEVATQYSDDPGSAKNGGSLGYVDKNNVNNFVPQFKDAVIKLNDGEVSEVIETQFGYHIIKMDEKTVEKLINNYDFISKFYQLSSTHILTPVIEKAKELNIEIVDENIKNYIDTLVKGANN